MRVVQRQKVPPSAPCSREQLGFGTCAMMYMCFVHSQSRSRQRPKPFIIVHRIATPTVVISSSFKCLGMRCVTVVPDDNSFVERSKNFLEYDMVTQFHPLNNT
jgi:hypothetical protein